MLFICDTLSQLHECLFEESARNYFSNSQRLYQTYETYTSIEVNSMSIFTSVLCTFVYTFSVHVLTFSKFVLVIVLMSSLQKKSATCKCVDCKCDPCKCSSCKCDPCSCDPCECANRCSGGSYCVIDVKMKKLMCIAVLGMIVALTVRSLRSH